MTEKNWIGRYLERTPEEHAALRAAAERRYAHLVNKPREWLADPTSPPPRIDTVLLGTGSAGGPGCSPESVSGPT